MLPVTHRQKVVLATLADMGTKQATADALGISLDAVRKHIIQATRRMGVHTALQAAVIVARYEALNGCQWSRGTRPAGVTDGRELTRGWNSAASAASSP